MEGGSSSRRARASIIPVWCVAERSLDFRDSHTQLSHLIWKKITEDFVRDPRWVCVKCLFLRTTSRAPYRTSSACAKRAAYPDNPPCVCVECLLLTTPSRAPYRTPPACAKRAAYPDPPLVVRVPRPESLPGVGGLFRGPGSIARVWPDSELLPRSLLLIPFHRVQAIR
jgi:hypothetical protein